MMHYPDFETERLHAIPEKNLIIRISATSADYAGFFGRDLGRGSLGFSELKDFRMKYATPSEVKVFGKNQTNGSPDWKQMCVGSWPSNESFKAKQV